MQNYPSLKINTFTVYYQNKEELLVLKKEIFSQHCYYFETNTARPFIIDAGAHIGLATVYFKKLYPLSRVVAIEPVKTNFNLLERNIWENNLENVSTIHAALSAEAGPITLHVDAQDAWLSTSSQLVGAWNGKQLSTPITVTAVQLSSILTEPVDLLKIDIEGSELAVLHEAERYLNLVDQLFIEFHPHAKQSLQDLLSILSKHQYHVRFSKHGADVPLQQAQGLVLIHAQRR